jgi:uncharacterized integral membrane protein (TIGR00698 family)
MSNSTPAPLGSRSLWSGAAWRHPVLRLLPGVALCIGVTLVADLVEQIEVTAFGAVWLEALVLSILIGTLVRTAWTPDDRYRPGIAFSAKMLLEIAVFLLGAAISARTILAAGPLLLVGIVAVVMVALPASYAIGRLLGLPRRMATLVACGNSICGNSAIAAVAPVIGADGKDIAASIAFTAVLGVIVVLALPLVPPLLHLNTTQYGVLAGLTVYAVPQVLAATAPLGPAAVQIGTLVKLVRVLMLGPVVLVLSLLAGRLREPGEAAPKAAMRPPLFKMVPWFILGFLALAALRSAGLMPQAALAPLASVSGVLTVISMAALGLGTDLKLVARAGRRVTATVTLSLILLAAVSLVLIGVVGVG